METPIPTKSSRPRRVCIVGARGVGKSSLVKAALPRLDGWVHLIGSEILSSLLPEGQTTAALDPLQRRNYRHIAAAFMLKQDLAGKTGLLCEGHCALYSDRTGTAEEVFTEADDALFTEIIELIAPADEVLRRRQRDQLKPRPLTLQAIEAEIFAEHQAARNACLRSGCKLTTLGADDLNGLLSTLHTK
jgi:adenylate kinase